MRGHTPSEKYIPIRDSLTAAFIITDNHCETTSILVSPFVIYFFWSQNLVFNFTYQPGQEPKLENLLIIAAIQWGFEMVVDLIVLFVVSYKSTVPIVGTWNGLPLLTRFSLTLDSCQKEMELVAIAHDDDDSNGCLHFLRFQNNPFVHYLRASK